MFFLLIFFWGGGVGWVVGVAECSETPPVGSMQQIMCEFQRVTRQSLAYEHCENVWQLL